MTPRTSSPRRPTHAPHRRTADQRPRSPDPSRLAETGSPAPRIAPALRSLAVPIGSVTPHPRNPRRGDVEAITASLERFGQQKPLVVQRSTMFVVAGNHLLRAARALGWSEIAANLVDLDDATATAYLLADNRTSDLGAYNDTLLAAILAEEAASANLAGTGYDADTVEALLAAAGLRDPRDPDEAPDLPAPKDVYVQLSDLWELGRHRLACGDARDPALIERLTGGRAVDLLWTDPPYAVRYVGKSKAALTIANDDLDEEGTRALVATALRRVPLKAGGAFYLASPAGPGHLAFLLALRDAELPVHQTVIWVKDHFVLGHGDLHYRHEPLLYGWRAGAPHLYRGDRTQDTVWEIPRPARSAVHPTMKPCRLVERALRNSSRPGERVLDPFLGSGTTLIAAEMTERVGLGIELDPAYCQVALERWAAFTGLTPRKVA